MRHAFRGVGAALVLVGSSGETVRAARQHLRLRLRGLAPWYRGELLHFIEIARHGISEIAITLRRNIGVCMRRTMRPTVFASARA